MAKTNAMKDKVQGKAREVKGAAMGQTGEEIKGKMQGMKGDAQWEMERQRDASRREMNRQTP